MAPTTHMRRVTAAACIAVMGVAGLSACTASGAADGGGAGEEETTALSPGVLPPNDPPQPGDARLGPDGHYDYSAPDFVLKNPCDTEYFDRALELGWKVPEIGTKRRDQADEMYCGVISNTEALALFAFPRNFKDFEASNYEVKTIKSGETSLVLLKRPTMFGEGCFAGIETPRGMIGGLTATGAFSDHTTIDEACDGAVHSIIPILGD